MPIEFYVCAYCDRIILPKDGVCVPCNEYDGALTLEEYVDFRSSVGR